jgi:hypothetical protein
VTVSSLRQMLTQRSHRVDVSDPAIQQMWRDIARNYGPPPEVSHQVDAARYLAHSIPTPAPRRPYQVHAYWGLVVQRPETHTFLREMLFRAQSRQGIQSDGSMIQVRGLGSSYRKGMTFAVWREMNPQAKPITFDQAIQCIADEHEWPEGYQP